jgi:hypothetical protein
MEHLKNYKRKICVSVLELPDEYDLTETNSKTAEKIANYFGFKIGQHIKKDENSSIQFFHKNDIYKLFTDTKNKEDYEEISEFSFYKDYDIEGDFSIKKFKLEHQLKIEKELDDLKVNCLELNLELENLKAKNEQLQIKLDEGIDKNLLLEIVASTHGKKL